MEKSHEKFPWLYDILFVLVLLVAAYLRFSGSNWGQLQHQHPDEGFLTSVTYDIAPIGKTDALGAAPTAQNQPWRALYPDTYTDCEKWGGYFDTACSPLNPHNRGKTFYTYGTLPVFMVRYLAEWTDNVDSLKLFGRQMSAAMDLLTILLLYIIVTRLYGRRAALLAAIFSSLAVMQIQQSHFYTTDMFANFFMFLALYFAVEIVLSRKVDLPRVPKPNQSLFAFYVLRFIHNPLFWYSLLFGLAFGMAMASKINAIPLAVLLPIAFFIRYYKRGQSLSAEDWSDILAFLVVGGLFAIIAFRIFQPYAFDGLGLNPAWLANIREQRAQATPNADLPWNLQWARRTHLFSFTNLTVWGLGLPLGILAWTGFLVMAWRMVKGEWRQHLLLWGWTAGYFLWQSLQYNPTMRYQLPIYPLLAMMAGWVIVWMWDEGRRTTNDERRMMDDGRRMTKAKSIVCRLSSVVLTVVVLALTSIWAFAFSSIYTRTETRIAASEWIYQNVPGPINLIIQQADGATYQQPIPFVSAAQVNPGLPYSTLFSVQVPGQLSEVSLPHVLSVGETAALNVTIRKNLDDAQPLLTLPLTANPQGSLEDTSQTLVLESPISIEAEQTYWLRVELLDPSGTVDLCGPLNLSVMTDAGLVEQEIGMLAQCMVTPFQPYTVSFSAQTGGALEQIFLANVADATIPASRILTVKLASAQDPQPEQVLASASTIVDFSAADDANDIQIMFSFEQPVTLSIGQSYYLVFETSGGALAFSGAAIANETDYDYPLPFAVSGYNGFGGIYRGDLNLQVYWDDNVDKLARFYSTLDQADYIFIPTNHQYGQITRLPERYPLMTVYYRALLGCPAEQDIIECYRVAEPGMFTGQLGFDLVATFESYPTLGPLVINDQAAEEAFTFYDHPKVLIFQKRADYDPAQARAILGAVDLSNVVHLLPGQADNYKSLLLPADRLQVHQAGGTWSELFDYDALQNRFPILGVVIWYVFIFLLGLIVYPFVRLVLPGLEDKGYPFARLVGLLLLGYLPWLAGSYKIPYSSLTIAVILGAMMVIGALLAYFQRDALSREWKEKGKYFLLIEGLFLAFFLLNLLIRVNNPDLWDPAHGGERPMEFAYFNAILRSTTFPPYDPWYAGGYLNYYYFGYVIVGTPVKLLGIIPSIAYNFILPTLFASLALGGFSVAWNLLANDRASEEKLSWRRLFQQPAFLGGITGAAAVILLGNLGIAQMFYRGFMCLGAPGVDVHNCSLAPSLHAPASNIFQRLGWAVKGFIKVLGGSRFGFGVGEWYYTPSRVNLPPETNGITEFPLFTFVHSDLHAHMMALPITVLAIAWAVSTVLALRKQAREGSFLSPFVAFASLAFGAFVIGTLKPTNTWDYYTYLALGGVALVYGIVRYLKVKKTPGNLPAWLVRMGWAILALGVLVGLSMLFYKPFTDWYSQAYTNIDPWKDYTTPTSVYLVHWGFFLFVITSWLAWETHQWLAQTPLSALNKLKPYQFLIEVLAIIFIALTALLLVMKVWIAWMVIPLLVWTGVLILRPGISDAKRFILFMIGTSLAITLFVELYVLRGDIGRMNTVFKFYLQVWVMLGVSAAACFVWLLAEIYKWIAGWRLSWQVAITLLFVSAALYLPMGSIDRIKFRWNPEAPNTLDGMAYMEHVVYGNYGVTMNLDEDYRAIRWLQENVQGSPVIVEAAPAGVQYSWLGRISIYTGLPSVIGWEWHQIQQRVLSAGLVIARGLEVDAFYNTLDARAAQDFLVRYKVRYIIVGQLERAKYTPTTEDTLSGLDKFEQYNGSLWQEVYRDGQTVIYEVAP